MIKYLDLLILLLCLFSSSCKENEEHNSVCFVDKKNDNITIDLDKVTLQKVNYSELIKKSKVISLETSDQCLIAQIKRIEILRDTFYIFDAKAGSILVFDNEGAFVRRIGKKGKGRGEYIHPKCFTLNRDKDEVLCFDSKLKKIIIYTLEGFLKKEIRIHSSHMYRNMCAKGESIYLDASIFSGRPKTKSILYCYDYDGELMWEWCPDNENIDKVNFAGDYNSKTLIATSDHIALRRNFMNTIYKCKDNKLSSYITFKTKHALSSNQVDLMKSSREESRKIIRDQNTFKGVDKFFENDSIIFSSWYLRNKRWKMIYSKNSNKYLFFTLRNIPSPELFNGFYGHSENYFYSILQGYAYSRLLENDSIVESYNLQPDSNPLIIAHTLKKDLPYENK